MLVVATFLINSVFNLALGLLVARFLGPQGFGQYALAASIAVALNILFLDWIRLAATRFYSPDSRQNDPSVRGTLDAIFILSSFGLALTGGVGLLLGLDFGLTVALAACAPAMGIMNGLYDYHTALLRARFEDRGYAFAVILKNVASLVLMVGGAWWFASPEAVMAGFLVSVAATLLVCRRRLVDPGVSILKPDWGAARRFVGYAGPVIAAALIYSLIPLLNRTALAESLGFVAAGQFSLAQDLGAKLINTFGSALDILLFQILVRTERQEGPEAVRAQLSINMGLVMAAILAVSVGYWLVLPSIEATVVPQAFRGPFGEATTLMLPGLASLAFVQAGLTPVFQLKGRTSFTIAAAVAALTVNALLVLWPGGGSGIGSIALAQSIAGVVALAVAAMLAWRLLPVLPRLRDVLAALAATAAMAAAVWPLRAAEPGWLVLFGSAAVGGMAFGATAVLLDLAGCRSRLRRRR